MAAFKVNITKNGNAIKFQFTDSDHYLYGNGEVEVPVNSLSLVIDESDFVTFKKASTNDTFITFDPANSNLTDKAGVIEFYKTNMVGSTGGGGSESGITSGDVQTMIDNSLEDYYDKDEVDSGFSTVNTAIAGKADTSAVTAVANDVSTLSGQVATKVNTTDFNTYSAATDARLAEDEEVTAAALNDLQENKADTSAVTAVANDVSTLSGAVDDAKAYYISFATLATQGISDDDWDGIVAAIDDHRPIYAGYPRQDGGIIYYGVECMNKNVSNTEIVMTASDNSAHYFYTFTKNGSNDYSYTVSTKPYVPDITTSITSGSTDSEIPTAKAVYDAIPTGGGATYSAGTNISIDTANTINCTIPAYFNSDEQKGDIAIGTRISNTHSDYYKVVIGRQIDTYGNANSSYSVGIAPASNNGSEYSQLKGNNSVGIGKYFQIRGHQSVAIGSEAKSSVVGGVAIGYGANASGTTKMNLNNQIKVDTNNQVYIKDKTNTTDVCIQDAIAALGGLKLVKLSQSEYDQLATKDNDTLYIISNVVA